MHVEAQAQHRWLQQMIGDWTYESQCAMHQDQPPAKASGRETVRALGELWTIGESVGSMPGGEGEARMQIALGFDPARQKFVGTFIGSMMPQLWTYEGTLDEAGQVLTLEAEGPSFTGEGSALYRDIVTLRGPDERQIASTVRGEDGSWTELMTATYRRVR
jgi:hypothetical protein